jgi:hypothetical protein
MLLTGLHHALRRGPRKHMDIRTYSGQYQFAVPHFNALSQAAGEYE